MHKLLTPFHLVDSALFIFCILIVATSDRRVISKSQKFEHERFQVCRLFYIVPAWYNHVFCSLEFYPINFFLQRA